MSVIGNGACEKHWCVESKILMPLATDTYSRNVFQYMKIDGGRGFQTGKNTIRIGGNKFCDQKIKVRWKFWSSKGPELE